MKSLTRNLADSFLISSPSTSQWVHFFIASLTRGSGIRSSIAKRFASVSSVWLVVITTSDPVREFHGDPHLTLVCPVFQECCKGPCLIRCHPHPDN